MSFFQTCGTVSTILEAPWFLVIDGIGTLAFAFYGALRAVRLGAPLGGILLMAAFPAVGGGLMRDMILSRHPVGFLSTPLYGCLILFAGLCVYFVYKYKTKLLSFDDSFCMRWILPAMDALGLATFTILGIAVASLQGVCPLWFWGPFFGCLTSCGGGILSGLLVEGADFLIRPNIDLRVAVPWSILLAILFFAIDTKGWPVNVTFLALLGIFGILVSRLFVFLIKR